MMTHAIELTKMTMKLFKYALFEIQNA